MGDCYFMSNYTNYRGEILEKEHRRDFIIRSEDLGYILNGDSRGLEKSARKLQNMINGSYGIFFYEIDLWNKEHLKKKLLEMINEIDKFEV